MSLNGLSEVCELAKRGMVKAGLTEDEAKLEVTVAVCSALVGLKPLLPGILTRVKKSRETAQKEPQAGIEKALSVATEMLDDSEARQKKARLDKLMREKGVGEDDR